MKIKIEISVLALTISVCSCDLFGDIDLAGLAKAFSQKCEYECPNGAVPRPNPLHKPKSNGCGSFGVQIEFGDDLPKWTSCCDAHDLCYDTCNKDREKCDESFHQCLKGLCEKNYSKYKKKEKEACKQTATMMYTSTTALGCSPFLEAQAKACSCDRTSKQARQSAEKINNERDRPGRKHEL